MLDEIQLQRPAVHNSSLNRIIRLNELIKMIGLSRSTIYNFINPKSRFFNSSFPRPVKLSLNTIGWYEGDVLVWLASLQKGA